MKTIIAILVSLGLVGGGYVATQELQLGVAPNVLRPSQGGTGIGSATAGDVGKVIKVLDDSPFTYELATDNSSAGSGSGNVATSSSEVSTRVPFWTSSSATPALLSGGSAGFTFDSTNSRLTVTSASTTSFSVFDEAKFGASATSSFNNAGVLTLATPLALDSGGTGFALSDPGEDRLMLWNEDSNTIVFANLADYTSELATEGDFFLYVDSGGSTKKTNYAQFTKTALIQTDATTLEATSTQSGIGLKLDYFLATSTSVTSIFSTAPTFSTLTSALLLTGAGGLTAEYTGSTCTNQAVTAISALGVPTCTTLTGAYVDLADLTATDTTLTFSGAYDGQTARTVGLNLGNLNTWTVLQTFGSASTTRFTAFTEAKFGSTATSSFDSAGVLTLATDLSVPNGGTGASTLTDHGVLVGSGASAIDALSVGTNGQLLVGSTGADPVFATANCGANLTCTLGAGTFQIDLDAALTALTGIVSTGLLDFGGGVLEIPNGTAPTADDAGELAHDTTDNQLILDDFVVARATEAIWKVTVASTSPAFISSGLLAVPTQLDGYTITRIQCHVTSGTSKVIAVEDASANSSEDITCATTNTTDDGTITNATYTASELSYIDFGASNGTVDYVTISVFGQWTRE